MSLSDLGRQAGGSRGIRSRGRYTVGKSIAYAYVPAARAEPATPVEVEIFGTWVPGQVDAEPLYDPEGARLRG